MARSSKTRRLRAPGAEKKVAIGALIGARTGAFFEKSKGAAAALFGQGKNTAPGAAAPAPAAAGPAVGTGDQLMTRGERVRIPSDTRLDFTLSRPLEVKVAAPIKN
jgi:hypothetical protein